METQTAPVKIEMNDQILFDRPNSMIVCTIVEVREKAVKADYAVEPVWAGSSGNNVIVFNYSCWIPKSVIIDDRGGLTVKKWFANTFKGGHHIKKYYLENGQKKYV